MTANRDGAAACQLDVIFGLSAEGDIGLKIVCGCCACDTGHRAAQRIRTIAVHRYDRVIVACSSCAVSVKARVPQRAEHALS